MREARLVFMEAIALRRAVVANYNGTSVKLAPHLLFSRHGDLFVGAVNLSRPARADGARWLGQFKLAGLAAAEVVNEGFEQLPEHTLVAPRSDDTVLMTI